MMPTLRKANYNSHRSPKASLLLFGPLSCDVSRSTHNINSFYTLHSFGACAVVFRNGTTAALSWHKLHSQRDQYAHEHADERSPADLVDPYASSSVQFRFDRQSVHIAASQSATAIATGTISNNHQYDIDQVSSFVVSRNGGVSCVLYREFRDRNPQKPTDQMTGRPTKWSARVFRKLLQRFGRQTPRRASLLSLDAACALLSVISAANENGRAMRSPPSFPKSLNVIRCGT